MTEVTIYTDGACSGNPGPGGWAAVLISGERMREISGYESETTNNRMEMTAAIEALSCLKRPCKVLLHSDSAYLVDAFRLNWFAGWIKRDWYKSNKEPVLNRDLWEKLLALTAVHDVTWIKVRGHANNEWNNRCDALATGEVKKHRED